MPNYDLGTAEGKIVLDSSGVDNAVAQANQSMGRLGKGVQSAERMGRDLTLGLTVPLVAVGGYALKTAIDFETAFAGVTKTISATDEQVAQLRQGIIDMSLEIPATTTEIAGVAEAAGQLGIAVEDIEEFTRVMLDLGIATNLSSTEAADAIAHVTNIMGTSVNDFGRFGAALVGLGNDSASTESEILEMGNRIAGIANLTGSTEAEMLSLAAALASVGVRAESGGTSVTKTIKDFDEWAFSMQEAKFNIEDMTDEAAAFYDLLGQNQAAAEEFVSLNGIQKFEFFIKAMQDAEANGGNLIAILKDMGLQEIRQSDAILRMVGAGDLLSDTLEVGNRAWEENTALTKEAGKRYETTASQLQIARNKADNAARILGEALIPMLLAVLDAITPMLEGLALISEAFQNLPKPMQTGIVGFASFLAVMGPILFIGAKMVKTLMALGGAVRFVASALRFLALAAATNPFILIALAIAALVVGFILLYKRSEKFRNFINDVGKSIKKAWEAVLEFFRNLPEFFSQMWDKIVEYFNTAKDAVVGAWDSVVDFFQGLWEEIANAFNVAKDAIAGFVTNAFNEIIDFFKELPGVVGSAVADAFGAFIDFLKKLPETIAYWLGFAIGRWIKLWYNFHKTVITTGIDIVKAVIGFMTRLPGIILDFLTKALNLVIGWGTSLVTTIIDIFTDVVTFAIEKLTEFVTWLPGFLMGIFNQFLQWGIQLVSWAGSTFVNFVEAIINQVMALPGKIAEFFTTIIGNLPGYASSMSSGAMDIGKKMVSGLVSGIGDLVKLVKDMVTGAINGVSSLGQTAYNKMKSIGESMWNGFKDGLFGSPHTKVEYAVWDMTENVDLAVSNLAAQVRTMQGLSRNIPLTATADPFVSNTAAMALSAGLGQSQTVSGQPSSVQRNYYAPLIGQASIRSDQDIIELARELDQLDEDRAAATGKRIVR